MKSKFKLDVWGYITIALLGAYAIFLLYPMLNLLRRSVYGPDGVFTLGYFSKFFGKKYYFGTLLNSLKVTLCTTVTTLLLGAPLAYFFTMYKIRGNGVLRVTFRLFNRVPK